MSLIGNNQHPYGSAQLPIPQTDFTDKAYRDRFDSGNLTVSSRQVMRWSTDMPSPYVEKYLDPSSIAPGAVSDVFPSGG